MADLGSFIGSGLKLAPDLNYLTNNASFTVTYQTILVNPSGGLTTALSLSGKYAIAALGFIGLTSGDIVTVELAIDNEIIINETFTLVGTTLSILNCAPTGAPIGATQIYIDIPMIQCDSSLVLKIQASTDTGCSCTFIARPIL